MSSTEVGALLEVSHVVSRARNLGAALDGVAAAAGGVVRADAASILLAGRGAQPYPFHVGGAWRLGPTYRAAIENPVPDARLAIGPAVRAVEQRVQVEITDALSDPVYQPWRTVAEREGYGSLVSTPLIGGSGSVLGTLDVFRAAPGGWSESERGVLMLMAEHAATAVRTAQFIDSQRAQLRALKQLVSVLKEQSHEHTNRLHTIHALLELEDPDAARRFIVQLQDTRAGERRHITRRVKEPTVAALLIAQSAIAQQRGIRLQLTNASRLAELPQLISEAEAVTVLGNLLDNAFDAVAAMPTSRRAVTVSLTETATALRWRVRDYGTGIPEEMRHEVFRRGWSLKDDHRGLGLDLVAQTVTRAGGSVSVIERNQGVTFAVTLPRG